MIKTPDIPQTKSNNSMKTNHITKSLILLICTSCLCLSAWASPVSEDKDISYGKWKITYKGDTKKVNFVRDGNSILKDVYVKAKAGNDTINSYQYTNVAVSKEMVSDVFGSGEKYTISYSGLTGKPSLLQIFYFYSGHDYFLTEARIISDTETSSNYIAPVYTTAENTFLPTDNSNRALRVPFDNDGFVHYLSSPLTLSDVSFEVTSIFNGKNRKGIVIGSVEHDTWKTGIKYTGKDNKSITRLECYGGITHELTRDISSDVNKPSKEHGSIKGKDLKSPKILFGVFDDWRRGMEQFGEANALIAPPRKWPGGTPFGWNSWAGMVQYVNPEGVKDVSDFIKTQLQPNNFENNNTVYIGLDSWWNENFTDNDLRLFVEHCHANGQKAGIYWGPFSEWGGNGERYVEGTSGAYQYKDLYLYADGRPRKIESWALDPTHPGTKMLIDFYVKKFKSFGFSYIKLDFINSGILEADSFYNPTVTTGVQAYNEGMKYLTDACGDDMFLALSIAPTFPAQYGTSKRISCDTWGAMTEGEYGSTGYMLNSLSFGWWLDRVYPFNDADHILLYNPDEAKDYKDGSNRARVTSAVITGIYMLGDNLSLKGSHQGDYTARVKNKAFVTNKDINDIARMGKSFYPVDGYMATAPGKAETLYTMETDTYLYFVAFNFDASQIKQGTIELARLGISADKIDEVKELWSGTISQPSGDKLSYSVAPQDVSVYRIKKGNGGSGIAQNESKKSLYSYVENSSKLYLQSEKAMKSIKILSVDGRTVTTKKVDNETDCQFAVSSYPTGVYIVLVETVDGEKLQDRFIK